jgi:hypothetical protein
MPGITGQTTKAAKELQRVVVATRTARRTFPMKMPTEGEF